MFKVGDIVRLKRGWTAMKVVFVHKGIVSACYNQHTKELYKKGLIDADQSRHHSEFVYWDKDEAPKFKPTNQEKEETMSTLYTWNENNADIYGTKIGVDSQGRWIMEPKGGGAPVALQKHDVSKVVPYSIQVMRMDGSGHVEHVRSTPKELKVDDLVMTTNGSLVKVIKLDTKCEASCKTLKGFLIHAVTLKDVET